MNTETLIRHLSNANPAALFANRRVGMEKESLRVTDNAMLAKTPHPEALGSALTHPYITMDFSEALLEFVTPPLAGNQPALDFMADLHAYVVRRLNDETLWAASMPCITKGETDVPLAHFGTSNAGMIKTIYRRGLGHRYGRAMQTIAGVHYNYSFSPDLWEPLLELVPVSVSLRAARDSFYMGMLRNLLRSGWIIPFLFGSSPAICKTFIDSHGHMDPFDETTLYHPHATSLRMGNIGYQNNQETEAGIHTSYNSLQDYVRSLKYAIETPFERYRRIGVKVNGVHQQLSDHVLQIENELYVTTRPKRRTRTPGEMPLLALMRDGVEYVELRSLDVLAHSSVGVRREQLDFIEAWLTFCLISPSAPIDDDEMRCINLNEVNVAHAGRDPDLKLRLSGKDVSPCAAGLDLCARMSDTCGLLDDAHRCSDYTAALNRHRDMFADPGRTPSARVLAEMRERRESHIEFVDRTSQLAHNEHVLHPISADREHDLDELARSSLRKQAAVERSDDMPLDDYIKAYFANLDEVSTLLADD